MSFWKLIANFSKWLLKIQQKIFKRKHTGGIKTAELMVDQ